MAVADPALTDRELATVRLELRRRAARKALRASRIATLRLAGLTNEQQRIELELSVDKYKRARGWLEQAVTESRWHPERLSVDEALRQFSDRHVEGCLRVGLLRQQGWDARQIQAQLRISRPQYEIADEWFRDAQVSHGGD